MQRKHEFWIGFVAGLTVTGSIAAVLGLIFLL